MSNDFKPQRNTFQETLLALEYEPLQDRPADIFSQACVASYTETDWTRFGYFFTQIFEPGVLREVALLEGVPYESLADLSYQSSATLSHLAELVEKASELSPIELVNLAAALISISRFEAATRLLDSVSGKVASSREKFEVAWLEFLISNRCSRGENSPAAFAKMREAIESGGVPRGRVLDACTQAVVWYLKRREIPEDAFTWWIRIGNGLAKAPESNRLDMGTVSSWYRGLAMLPAARGKASETRKFMELAREAAEQTIALRPGAYELNTIKTYYESTMKEHMYVTKNFEAAEEAGHALITLDPVWAPSYGELAEVYEFFGRVAQAAEFYERAAEAGPPYWGHHLLRAAKCQVKSGNDEVALSHYLTLAEIAPENASVLQEGLNVARRLSSTSQTQFECKLNQLGQ
jgi:tetratricopeptide (TPR) repeat protein